MLVATITRGARVDNARQRAGAVLLFGGQRSVQFDNVHVVRQRAAQVVRRAAHFAGARQKAEHITVRQRHHFLHGGRDA